MKIRVNGQEREVTSGQTLVGLLEEMRLDRRYLVVEHNAEPIARDRFDEIELHEGDVLELVRPVAGG